MKKLMFLILTILTSISLISCIEDNNNERTGETVSITHTVSKVLSKDEEGNVTNSYFEEVTEDFYINPNRVVTFNLGVADIFLYIGLDELNITKFGIPKDGKPLAPSLKEFNKSKYIDVGTLFIPNYDVLDLFNPELIILDGRTSNLYEDLKIKYPYADVLDLSLTTYEFAKHQQNMINISKIFPNTANTLNDLINEFEQDFTYIQSKTEEYRLMFVQLNGEVISVATGENGRYGLVYKEFGFQVADPDSENKSENNHGTMGANLEYIKLISPEVIFVMDRNMIVNNEPSNDFTKEPLLRDVDAIINNHVYYLEPNSWYTISGGIYATRQMIADVMEFINNIENT